MQTSAIYATGTGATTPVFSNARRSIGDRLTSNKIGGGTSAVAPMKVQSSTEKNGVRISQAVASALTLAIMLGATTGVVATMLGLLVVSGLDGNVNAATLAFILAAPAGSALVGGLIGAWAALRIDEKPAKPKRASGAKGERTPYSRSFFSDGTSPPRYSHELL